MNWSEFYPWVPVWLKPAESKSFIDYLWQTVGITWVFITAVAIAFLFFKYVKTLFREKRNLKAWTTISAVFLFFCLVIIQPFAHKDSLSYKEYKQTLLPAFNMEWLSSVRSRWGYLLGINEKYLETIPEKGFIHSKAIVFWENKQEWADSPLDYHLCDELKKRKALATAPKDVCSIIVISPFKRHAFTGAIWQPSGSGHNVYEGLFLVKAIELDTGKVTAGASWKEKWQTDPKGYAKLSERSVWEKLYRKLDSWIRTVPIKE